MKKYLLAIGLVAFLMTSCCDKTENAENKECCKEKKEQCDKHHECDHNNQAPCPEMMRAMDKIIECVANWSELTEEQQTEVIDMAKKMQEMKANMPKHECCKEGKPECCKHEGKCEKHEGECKHHEGCKNHEGGCKHGEGHKCDGNHEKCQHQHEGCQHGEK